MPIKMSFPCFGGIKLSGGKRRGPAAMDWAGLWFLPDFHLHEIMPSVDSLHLLLPPNPHLGSMKIERNRLNDSAISLLVNPFLHEIRLQNCENSINNDPPGISQLLPFPNLQKLWLVRSQG